MNAAAPSRRRESDAHALRQREALRRVVEEISSELELRPLLTGVVRHACELLEASDGSIGLYEPGGDLIRIEAVHHMPASELGAEMRRGVGLAGLVLERGAPVVARRYGSLPQPTLPELADNAVVGVPIVWRDELIGFFGLGARPPHEFDATDVEVLSLFARHAAVAIANARRHASETQRMARLAALEERRRLARELHDSVTQLLFSASLLGQTIGPAFSRDPVDGEARARRLIEVNQQALAEMRALLRELRPDEAERLPAGEVLPGTACVAERVRDRGLVPVLEARLAELAADGFEVHLHHSRWRRQAPDLEIELCRLACEALHNAVKHARAGRLDVRLAVAANRLRLEVSDDGQGFDPAAAPGRGFGLPGMRERVRARGGELELSSQPGHGTRVVVALPVSRPASQPVSRPASQPVSRLTTTKERS